MVHDEGGKQPEKTLGLGEWHPSQISERPIDLIEAIGLTRGAVKFAIKTLSERRGMRESLTDESAPEGIQAKLLTAPNGDRWVYVFRTDQGKEVPVSTTAIIRANRTSASS